MESILVLTHADESGSSLTKASLEAVTAGHELATRLGAELAIGIVRVHLEEALMRDTFPGEYDRYSRHTARLIPGVY